MISWANLIYKELNIIHEETAITTYIQDNRGRFQGRKHVSGRGDTIGILFEDKG